MAQEIGNPLAADEYFIDWADLPDETDGMQPDGDDSALAEYDGKSLPEPETYYMRPVADTHVVFSTPKAIRRVIIPIKRTMKKGMVGLDIRACQRALIQAKIRTQKVTGTYHLPMVDQVSKFQAMKKLTTDGVLGPVTFRALLPYFDAYAEQIYLSYHPVVITAEQKARNAIEAAAIYGYNHAAEIHYTQGSLRMQAIMMGLFPPPKFGRYYDCSSFATWCYRCAKVLDPNGYRNPNYPGYGYTGTLLANAANVPVSVSNAMKSALYMYGSGVGRHVSIAVGNKGSRMCISHGSESGPHYCRYDYRGDFSKCIQPSLKALR